MPDCLEKGTGGLGWVWGPRLVQIRAGCSARTARGEDGAGCRVWPALGYSWPRYPWGRSSWTAGRCGSPASFCQSWCPAAAPSSARPCGAPASCSPAPLGTLRLRLRLPPRSANPGRARAPQAQRLRPKPPAASASRGGRTTTPSMPQGAGGPRAGAAFPTRPRAPQDPYSPEFRRASRSIWTPRDPSRSWGTCVRSCASRGPPATRRASVNNAHPSVLQTHCAVQHQGQGRVSRNPRTACTARHP